MFRNRSTLIYLALALGLVCYLTFIDKKIPGTAQQEEADSQLFSFDQQEVTGLEVTNIKGSFIFQKKNDHWEMTSPVATLADTPAIAEIISYISAAKPQRTIQIDPNDKSTENNLKEWGLSPPAEKVILHLKDKSLELLIGRKIAINDSVYARGSGRKNAPVRIISNDVKKVLQKSLSDFRSRNVFDFEVDKATRISTRVANTATTPEQDCEVDFKDGKWTLQKPLIARAATGDVDTLLNKILALRVGDFVTDDPSNLAQYGLTSPTATLSVTVVPDEEGALQIGSPVPGKTNEVYAQRLKSNSVFTLTQTMVDELLKALPNVRDRHILTFDPGKVTALSFEIGTKKVDLKREKGLWNVTGDSGGMADIGKVTDAISRLSQLETTPAIKDSAPDLKPFGLDKPSGKITITSPELKTPLTLTIGKDENHSLYVRNSIEPFIYTVPEASFDFLDDSLSYRDHRVVDLKLAKVRTMTITPQGQPSLVLNRSAGGTWSAANAKDRMIDSPKAETQASLICQLQAESWLGAAQPAYALNKPILTISIEADQPSPTVLHIGAPLPDGGRAAQIEGSKTLFELSAADFGLLNASSLQLIPAALENTNAPSASTNAPTATNAPAATEPAKDKHAKHKKKTSE